MKWWNHKCRNKWSSSCITAVFCPEKIYAQESKYEAMKVDTLLGLKISR